MRAMHLIQHQSIENLPLGLADISVPQPDSGEVLLQVTACGVCHTDLHTVEGDIHPPHLPLVPGHQVVGRVVALGERAPDWPEERPYPEVGQRVGVPWLYSACGVCEFCRRGQENLCPQARFTGFHVNGGYAEAMLGEARYLLPIPGSMPDIQAAPLLCAGIIGYRSLRLAEVEPGERVGLVGFGASAHLAIQVARYWGCEVFVFTRSLEHRRHADSLGAAWSGGIEDDPGIKLDRAIIFAPAGRLVPATLEKLRPAGTLAINAIYMSPIPEMAYELIYGERTLRSVANATYQDGVEFLQLAAEIPLEPTLTTYPLEQANQALLDLKNSRLNGEAVLVV